MGKIVPEKALFSVVEEDVEDCCKVVFHQLPVLILSKGHGMSKLWFNPSWLIILKILIDISDSRNWELLFPATGTQYQLLMCLSSLSCLFFLSATCFSSKILFVVYVWVEVAKWSMLLYMVYANLKILQFILLLVNAKNKNHKAYP